MKNHTKFCAALAAVLLGGITVAPALPKVGPGRATVGPVSRPAPVSPGAPAMPSAPARPGMPAAPGGGAGLGGGVSASSEYVPDAELPRGVPPQPNGKPWMCHETPHFRVFHDQKIFAEKVGRLGEQFYDYISADMPGMADRMGAEKSIICIFRKPEDWQAFLAAELQGGGGLEWSASFVRGQYMYLQATGDHASERMRTLAHEMTHLVFNRFLATHLPNWLNEGLAEFYGQFAYRAVRGMGVSKKSAFPPIRDTYPLAAMLGLQGYPEDVAAVHLFYATSRYLVGFLELRDNGEPWKAAWERIRNGEPPVPAILQCYGFADVAEMEKEFQKFCH